MYRYKILIIAVFLTGIIISGFECASTEMTSAKLYISQKNYSKALAALKEEVAKNPQNAEGFYLLGRLNGELGNFDSMVVAFDKSVAISNQFASDIRDSRIYFWGQAFNQGVKLFSSATATQDKDSAKIYYDKSAKAFNDAIILEPDSVDTYKNLAFVYMNEQKFDEAMKPLRISIEKKHAMEGYRYLGEIIYEKAVKLRAQFDETHNVEDSIKAVDEYNNVIKLLEEGRKYYPENSDFLLMLSNSYIGANKIETAINAFKEGVQKEPDNKYYRYNYGVLLLGKKEYTGAEEQFKKAIEIDPSYQNAVYNLGVTYVKWGADLAKEALAKGDQNTGYKAKYEAAVPLLEKVLEVRSDDATMWELLGRVYTALGQESKAKEAFEKSDKLRSK